MDTPSDIQDIIYRVTSSQFSQEVDTMYTLLTKRFGCTPLSSIDEIKKTLDSGKSIPLIEVLFAIDSIPEQRDIIKQFRKDGRTDVVKHPNILMMYSVVEEIAAHAPSLDLYFTRMAAPETAIHLDLVSGHMAGFLNVLTSTYAADKRQGGRFSQFSLDHGLLYRASSSFVDYHAKRIATQQSKYPVARRIPLDPHPAQEGK